MLILILKPWDTYYDISTYIESGPDENNYESNFSGEENPVPSLTTLKLRTRKQGSRFMAL